MNINSISTANIPSESSQAFKASKVPTSRIKFARDLSNKEMPVNDYVKAMLTVYGDQIEKVANYIGKDVVLAQRGNLLLANSGARTTAINLNGMENGRDLISGIINNLKINA